MENTDDVKQMFKTLKIFFTAQNTAWDFRKIILEILGKELPDNEEAIRLKCLEAIKFLNGPETIELSKEDFYKEITRLITELEQITLSLSTPAGMQAGGFTA